jgi:hypothetical protein
MIVASEEDALEFAKGHYEAATSASSRKQMKEISNLEQYTHVVFNIGDNANIAEIIKTEHDLMVCRQNNEYECYVILSQVPLKEGDDYFFISFGDARDDRSSSTEEEKGISAAVYGPITCDDQPVALRKVETGAGGDCFFSSFSKILEEIVVLEKSLPNKEQCVTSKLQDPLSTYVWSHANDADEEKSWIESRTSEEKSQAVRNICAQSFVQLANEQTKNERGAFFARIMLHILTMDKDMDKTVIDDVKSIFPSSLRESISTYDDPRQSMISALTIEDKDITIQDTQFNLFRDWVASWICKMGSFHEGTAWDSHLLHGYFPNIKVITIAEKSWPYRFEFVSPYDLPGDTRNEQATRLLESVSKATHRAFIVYTHGFEGRGHYQTLLAQFLDEKRTIICKEELALSIVEEAWNNYCKKEFIRVKKQYYTLPLPGEFDKILGVDLKEFKKVTNECYAAENLDQSYHQTQIEVRNRNKYTTKQITDMEIKSYSLMTKCINLLTPGRRVLMKLVPLSLLDNESNPYPFDTKVLQGDTWEEPQETQERMIIFTVERYMQVGVYDKNFVTCFAKDMCAYATHQFISEISDNLKNRAVFVGKLQIDQISRDFICRTFVNASILMQGIPTREPLNRTKCDQYLSHAQMTAPSSDGKQKIVVYV